MAFTSVNFAFFMLLGVPLYYFCPKKLRYLVLLALSYVFYLSGGVYALGYILFTTFTTYFFGRCIDNVKPGGTAVAKEEKIKIKNRKKIFAAAALILNFGLLYFVKYWNFTLDLIHVPNNILRFNILLPLGISFYIFQSAGYIIDLVRGKYPAQKNIFKYALFVSFFPQITQGPIGRYDALQGQLYDGCDFSFDNIKDGSKLILRGLILKMVIADRASVAVCSIVDNYKNFSGSFILFGVILYCIQLYCDFSGGIDIARGSAKFFGITLAENFNRPLFAKSLAEFWRRWHITLGSWLRDYLFYPITLSKPFINLGKFMRKHIKGKAGKILPTSLATFIIYFIIGIWHGANFKYILFGCYNGIIITLSLLIEPYFIKIREKAKLKSSALYNFACVIRTSLIVLVGRYITRAENVSSALEMLKITFCDFNFSSLFGGSLLKLGLEKIDFVVIAAGIFIVILIEFFNELGTDIIGKIENLGVVPSFLLTFVFVSIFIYFGVYRGNYISSEFIYKQF